MANVEMFEFRLPSHIVAEMRAALAEGAYASMDDLVSDALNAWSMRHQGLVEDVDGMRTAWQEAIDDESPGIPMDEVFDRLEAKCRAMIEEPELVR